MKRKLNASRKLDMLTWKSIPNGHQEAQDTGCHIRVCMGLWRGINSNKMTRHLVCSFVCVSAKFQPISASFTWVIPTLYGTPLPALPVIIWHLSSYTFDRKGDFPIFKLLPKCTFQENWLPPPGEGGTPIYKLYGCVPHFRVWFSSCFSLK